MKRGLKLTRTLTIIIAAAVASQLAHWGAFAADTSKTTTTSTSTLSKKDVHFINDAAEGGMMEIHMGELGQQKGQSADVKSLAARLVSDHTKANDELKQLASSKGVTLPSALPDKHQKTLDKLSSSSDFDKAFKDMAIKDHKKDVKEFEHELKRTDADPDLKSWTAKTLPVLQEHLRLAEQLGVARTTKR